MFRIFALWICIAALSGCSVTYTTDDGRPVVLGLINWVKIEPPKHEDGTQVSLANLDEHALSYGYEAVGISFTSLPQAGGLTLGYKDISLGVFGNNACYIDQNLVSSLYMQPDLGEKSND